MIGWAFGGKITDSPEEFNHKHDLNFCLSDSIRP
jgi:hypothetical protein